MEGKFLKNPLNSVLEMNSSKIKSKIILVRHAESFFNLEIKNLENLKNEIDQHEYFKLKNRIRFDHGLIDCEITQKGIEQCRIAGKCLKDYKIKYIFVSPLKRCLMTLENILKISNHSNSDVIVHPLIFEKIEDSCDVLKDINLNMKSHEMYDWSMFRKIEHLPIYQLKFCDLVYNREKEWIYYNEAIDNLKKFNEYRHHHLILNAMEHLSKSNFFIESSKKTFERLQTIKNDLNSLISKLNEDEKILVVGHSIIFKHLASKLVEEISSEPKKDEYVLENCEIAGLSFI
jgi:broad specificity phosphatase PhoE